MFCLFELVRAGIYCAELVDKRDLVSYLPRPKPSPKKGLKTRGKQRNDAGSSFR